ncbi:DUF1828 domain-containing protein [Massilia sp. PAMC28688]|uniref:DUF1828 domain-containing protein n=1 Tax=Massilia sp. PAMC28688 TaxID=2861283 RepID=UPI001C62B101|nr:DUF1828 domain-containing protein [Massilia sp. PAMC28688]QYF94213.1 DUF1828 domain-containing protein [Massilia sp. PAMC28688]
MICSKISELIGFECHPLSDDGSVAMIDTPFAFADGDGVPVYVEKLANQVRFFDDGNVILHFRGRGVTLDDHRHTRFLRNLAEPNGVQLNAMGELEIWAKADEAPAAFARYMSTLLAVCAWEVDQTGASTDTSLFLDEVTMCLRAWKPHASIGEGADYVGVSGQVYKMDLQLDGRAVLAIGTHPATVSTAAKKLLDISAATENAELDVLVVIDDRQDAELAKREGLVLDSVSSVLMMTRLERNANTPRLQ